MRTATRYDGLPSILGSPSGCRPASGGTSGLRQLSESGAVPFADGIERLDRQAAVDAVWLGLEQDHGPALDRMLDRLYAEAHADRYGSVVSAPPALIDIIAGRATHERMIHLCEANEAERIAAIRQATERARLELHDVGADGQGQLRQLSEEVGRIAHILANLSESEAKDRAAHGQMGKVGSCFAELEDDSPWEPLAHARDVSDVFFARVPHRLGFGDRRDQIAGVHDLDAEGGQALPEAGDAERRGAHINSAAVAAEI